MTDKRQNYFTMKKALSILILFVLTINSFPQNWTEPVNVSNMGGFNQLPDYCFDNNGVIHCVWVHIYETNYSKIFYCKSYDDGLTWTTPEDISLNIEKRVSDPHIVCDSQNNLHLTYDYDIGNYLQSLVYYKKFDGTSWSIPIVVSENMPESHENYLVIDNADRIYCFWFRILYNNGTTFYRYLENDVWSDIFIPYDNSDYFPFLNCAVDSQNNLHWIGAHYYEWQTAYEIKPVYFYYDYENDEWSDFVKFGERYSWYGFDIDLDVSENPHLVWQEFTNDSTPPNDGTFYTYYNGTAWTEPELIVEDPRNQQIIIDNYNKPNIFDTEKIEDGSMIVHYYLPESNWEGYIIDNAEYNGNIKIQKYNNKIYLLYEKGFYGKENSSEIFFSNTDMINIINKKNAFLNNIKIYPNPSLGKTTISYSLKKANHTSIKIYDLQGKLKSMIINKKQAPGKYKILWNGTDKNGKEVTNGTYLIRLQAGRQVMTHSVEIIK
jgi:hypothetical protein